MSLGGVNRLSELASDPSLAPLALRQAEALRACADPAWERGLPEGEWLPPTAGSPLLHAAYLGAEPARLAALLDRLAAAAPDGGAEWWREVSEKTGVPSLALLEAAINLEGEEGAEMPDFPGLTAGAVLAQLGALPLLQAAGRRAAPLLVDLAWEEGYCPVCAAWPTLAEVRGPQQARWLRCGRCGAAWPGHHQRCAFCANDDHRRLTYLSVEDEGEGRRVQVCDRCGGYLKVIASLVPFETADLFLADLRTLTLDLVALDRGCARPEGLGVPLGAKVVERGEST